MLITQEYDPIEEMEALKEEAWEYGLEEGRAEGLEKGREEGLEKGREEGLEKGREEGMITAARNALAKGIPAETVQEITGLDMEVIDRLKK